MTIDTLRPDELTPEVVREMHTLYGKTVDKFFYGRRYLNLRFFELVAARFKERLAWVVARREGKILAGAFNVQRGRALYGRYWGAHVDMPFLHFNVCYYHGIRHCLAHGLDSSSSPERAASTSASAASFLRSPSRTTGSPTRGFATPCRSSSAASARPSQGTSPRGARTSRSPVRA